MKVKLLGAAQEVGRSGILLTLDDGSRILLDYGVSLEGEEPQFPLPVKPKEISFVSLSHAHLDHSGALPLLYVSASPPLVTTPLTLSLSDLLIRDFLKLSKYYVPYEYSEVKGMMENAVLKGFNESYEFGGVTVSLVDAGHIPGSAMISIDTGSYTVVYTGDYALHDTCLLRMGDKSALSKADLVVTESTYAEFDHPPRDWVEREFIATVTEVIEGGGTVLIPAFAVGRAQEILCVLAKYNFPYKVYVDGMAKAANDLILEDSHLLRDPGLFEKAVGMATKVRDWNDRKKAVEEASVIVSPAGMLQGGPSEYYMEKIMEKEKNAVIFVSFAIPETPARQVLETGVFASPTKKGMVKARVEWFDFSAHCGKSELIETVKISKSNAKFLLVHGEAEAERAMKNYVEEQGREALMPALGEEVEIEI
ncbi:MBL fold metallo-hydrolase [Infirmifilum sp. NZ]|uniref:MBL fold metallo-hydrolase n=1 Tax=Infirmifilum sp. NZ TaxID=2926850 RepID=UPI0027A28839|nr:MBL fold metallo-hydrolase [Infirmifilum sp. NZ]UNQ72615.1 MBL fold metallo-hydrolase [Infirmifilum sp. NZ]